jgi:hypothetical protein
LNHLNRNTATLDGRAGWGALVMTWQTMGSKKGSDWDSSSRMGGDAAVPMEKLVAAQALLSEDPELRATHSTRSVMSLLDQTAPRTSQMVTIQE